MRTDDHDERLVKLVANVTGIECGAARAIGKSTTIAGAGLHAAAAKILAAQGKRVDDATSGEYLAALERAEQELGDYAPATDVFAI